MDMSKEIENRIWLMNDIGVTALYIANHFGIPIHQSIAILDALCVKSDNIVNIGIEYFWKD